MNQLANLPVTIDMVMPSGDLPYLTQAAEGVGGSAEELVKNETDNLLTVNLENFDQGIIPVGKSGFKITLPAEFRENGERINGFWRLVSQLREQAQSANKETK